jgi:hypothetical protein
MNIDTTAGYKGQAIDASNDYGVDPIFLTAALQQESSWDPNANDGNNHLGIGQFSEPTAQAYGITNRYDPSQSIYGAAAYYSDILDKNGGNYVQAAQTYGTLPTDLSNLTSGQQDVLQAAQSANVASGYSGGTPTDSGQGGTGGVASKEPATVTGGTLWADIGIWITRVVIAVLGIVFVGVAISMFKDQK